MSLPIVLVTELFPPDIGGSAVLFENVYGRLDRVSVTVLTNSEGATNRKDGRFRCLAATINGSYRGVRPFAAFAQHLRLARMIRRLHRRQPSVVHCARPLPEGAAGLFAQILPGRAPRYVSWTHGEDLAAAMTSREHAWLARLVCRRAAAVVANSSFSSGIVQRLGVPAERIRVVHPGVDAVCFGPGIAPDRPRYRVASDADPILLTVGRLQRRKGHDAVIESVATLRKDLPNLCYLIAGDGEERARLESLAAARGVAERVHFLGKVADEDLPSLYATCDVFIMPNRVDGHDVEGFGIVFLEAAASERPTIGGRSGGVPEAIMDGETGLLVDGASQPEIVEAIRTLATSPALRASMGRAGRLRVLRAFTWEHASARLRAVHDELAVTAKTSS